MHYSYDLTIPAQTLKANKLKATYLLGYGILKHVSIFFKWGCSKYVHVQIFRRNRQIFPSNSEEDYSDNDYHIDFDEFFPILEEPYELEVRGWNLDDFFEHTVTFRFSVLHPTVLGKPDDIPSTTEELTDLLGEYKIEEVS
jgi:hypothetical protein